MKKSLAVIISALLVITLFASCKTNKPENALSPDTKTEAISNQETVSEEIKTTLPEKEESQLTTNKAVAPTKAPEKPTSKSETTTKNKTNTPTVTQSVVDITYEEAKEIVLGHAGLTETDISRYKSELDRERKTIVYEIEFDSGKYEYDYEINAETGKIIKAEKEFRD